MANPATSFNIGYSFISAVFRINQQQYDDYYMLIPLEQARSLLHYENEISALELKIKEGVSIEAVEKQIKVWKTDILSKTDLNNKKHPSR